MSETLMFMTNSENKKKVAIPSGGWREKGSSGREMKIDKGNWNWNGNENEKRGRCTKVRKTGK
jgi:hypothetical protein